MNWYREIGVLVEALESPDFPGLLITELRHLVTFDLATIFVHQNRAGPRLVFDNFRSERTKRGLDAYLDHTYVLNPFYQANRQGLEAGVYRIGDLAPDGFFESELSRVPAVTLNPSEEIGYITDDWPVGMEEVDIAVTLDRQTTGEISIYRPAGKGGFEEDQLDRLRLVHPVVTACFKAFWSKHAHSYGADSPPDTGWADRAFESFGSDRLTGREREVVRLVLRGHSSESIGYHLEISITTVKTHRKHAYDKLGISTQAELLSAFLRYVREDGSLRQPR